MKQLITLWKFSRPHTIIGSVISIYTLYTIVCSTHQLQHVPLLIMALIVGITCNIFIVGINQIADVDIDKINKPNLPIPAGLLTIKEAKTIVYASLIISLALALSISPYLFVIIIFSTFIGWAYSMPPLYLKQHHILAAISISTVRGVMVNVGGFLVFNHIINNSIAMPENVKILTVFIIAFSIVISWFKDLPDIEGDKKYHIKTFAILYSSKFAWIMGSMLLGLAYLFTIYFKYVDLINVPIPGYQTKVLLYGHIILFTLFIINSFFIKLNQQESIKKFYKRFWWFFFAEYLLYLIAYLNY